jgi:hypothetical protein
MTSDDPAVTAPVARSPDVLRGRRLASLRAGARVASRWLVAPVREMTISLRGVPAGYRVLVWVAYGSLAVFLIAALAVELAAERGALPTMVIRTPVDAPDTLLPAVVPALMLATSALGLALILTGGTDRGLGAVAFVVSIWIATPIVLGVAAMGPRSRSGRNFDVFDHMDRVDGLLLLVVVVVAALCLVPWLRDFWHAHPVLEFCLWAPLLPALAVVQWARGASWDRFGEAMNLAAALSLLALILVWTLVGWDVTWAMFRAARWTVRRLLREGVPLRAYSLFVVTVLLLMTLLMGLVVRAAGDGLRLQEFIGWLAVALGGCLVAAAGVRLVRRWSIGWASTFLALAIALPAIAALSEATFRGLEKDPAALLLNVSGVVPATPLFTLLTLYELLKRGAQLTRARGGDPSGPGFMLVYLGMVIWLLGGLLWALTEREIGTGRPPNDMRNALARVVVAGTVIGLLWLAFRVVTERDRLVTGEEASPGHTR